MLAVSIMFYLGERNKLRDNNKVGWACGDRKCHLGNRLCGLDLEMSLTFLRLGLPQESELYVYSYIRLTCVIKKKHENEH